VRTLAAMKRRRLYSGRCNCVNEQSFTDFCPTQRINRPIVREEPLGRPGGNITGLATNSADVAAKRLELLRATVPRLRRADQPDPTQGRAGSSAHARCAARPGVGAEAD
jgi:hypothetical protein